MSAVRCLNIIAILSLLAPYVHCERLDTLMRAEHYDLIALPVIAGDRAQLCGHVAIDFRVDGSTNVVTFNSVELSLVSVGVEPIADRVSDDAKRLASVEDLCFFDLSSDRDAADSVQLVHEDASRQQVSVVTKQMLRPGVEYRISILYRARVRDGETWAFFRGAYTEPHSCCQRWFGATQMEIAHARKVLPCLDEPNLKATFKVTLGHEWKTNALSNMPDVSSTAMSLATGWAWTAFEATPPMPAYLLALVVTEFEHATVEYENANRTVLLRFWARPGRMRLVRLLMDAAPLMIRFLETYLEQPFPLPKIDFFAPPVDVTNFLAMENWGLILFSEQRYYFDETKDTRMMAFEILQTMAHELAHQYFGNLVTSDWWSDIWLNEGFAGFFEFAIAERVLPTYRGESDANRASGAINAHRYEESNPNARAVFSQVSTPEEAGQNFDILSYSKGNVLLSMLQHFMGHERFRKGLVAYFDRYKFKSANSTHLWQVMNEQLQKDKRAGNNRLDVREIMETWTHQPSFPLIKCYRTPSGKVKLSQQSFPGKRNVQPGPWWVPLSIVNGRNADFSPKGMPARLWLSPQRAEIEVAVNVDKSIDPLGNDTWVLVGGELTVYARVDYDELNWELICQQLMDNHTRIPRLTRIKLIDDAFTLAVNGLINFFIPLAAVEYLGKVDDEHVLPTALRHLRDIRAVVADNSTVAALLQEYIDKVTKQTSKQSGLARSANGSTLTKSKCDSGDENCISQAIGLFNALIDRSASDDEQRFALDEFHWLGCVAIEKGGDEEWRFAWRQSLNRNADKWHAKIYRAMGCSKSDKRIHQLLSRPFRSAVREAARDAEAIVASLARSPARPHVIDFVMDNWSLLETRLEPAAGGPMNLLESITSQSSAAKELRKIANFFKQRDLRGRQASKAYGILEKMRKNIGFIESRLDHLYGALSKLERFT